MQTYVCVCVSVTICVYISMYLQALYLGRYCQFLQLCLFRYQLFILCPLYADSSSRNSLPTSVESHEQSLELLSKTTASSTCFLETSAAFCQLVDISKSGHSAVLFYAVFTIFQFSLKSLLRKSFVLCGS